MKKILTLLFIVSAFYACGDDEGKKDEAAAGCESIYCDEAGNLVQPVIGVREGTGKSVITVEGYNFKDSNGNGSLDAYEDWRLSISERAEDLVGKMNLNEKVGFINAPGLSGSVTADGLIPETHNDYIAITTLHRRYGLIRLSSGPEQTATFSNSLQQICEGALRDDGSTGLGIPYVVSADPLHGSNSNTTGNLSLWPNQIGFGAINDPKITREFAEIAREELKANGIRMTLSPMADIATELRWSRVTGTFGSNKDVAAENVVQYIKGFQGGDKLTPQGVICAVKHFPGHGAEWKGYDAHGRMGRNIVVSDKTFEDHLLPFRKAFSEAHAAACMPCYGIYVNMDFEKVGAGYNKDIMTELGRDELGFEGFYTADWGLFNATASGMDWGVEGFSLKQRIGKAVGAGMDQLGNHGTIDDTLAAVTDGYLAEDALDRACNNILKQYFALGIFENPYVDASKAVSICNSSENEEAGFDAMHKSIVCLKNGTSVQSGWTTINYPALPMPASSSVYYDGSIKSTDPEGAPLLAEYGATSVASPELADFAVFRLSAPSFSSYPGEGGFGGAQSRSLQYIDTNPDVEFGVIPADYTDPMGNVYNGVQVASNISSTLEKIQNARIAIDNAGSSTKIVVVVNSSPSVVSEYIADIDALFYSFGCTDNALLDILFSKDGLKPTGIMPFEIPSSNEFIEASFEEVADDTLKPSYEAGTGSTYQD